MHKEILNKKQTELRNLVVEKFLKEDNLLPADDLTIGAMKAYALGRRGKWKDYTDLINI